jgi:hypothetical protein
MRSLIALTWVAVAAVTLTGCAAQNATRSPSVAPEDADFSYVTRVILPPGPQCPAYRPEMKVVDKSCGLSHPYFREARTLVVGPAPRAEFDVTLALSCPALQDKVTLTVMRSPGGCRYFIGVRPLPRHSRVVLEPGRYQIFMCVYGRRVPVANVELVANTDYFATLGEI